MKIKSIYLVHYREPFSTKSNITKLYKCFDGKRNRWFLDKFGVIEETNRDFAATLKRTMQ